MKTQIGEQVKTIIGELIDSRNDKGFETYKETLDDVPFENYDWNKMVIEELLDGMQYMVKENNRLKVELEIANKKLEKRIGFDDFQEKSTRTLPEREFGVKAKMNLSNYALGLCGEAGEVGEIVKKHVHHGHDFNEEDFKGEVGDVLHYLSGLCSMYGVELSECAWENIIKLQERYPEGFNSNDSVSRVDMEKKHLNSLYGKFANKGDHMV